MNEYNPNFVYCLDENKIQTCQKCNEQFKEIYMQLLDIHYWVCEPCYQRGIDKGDLYT